MKLLHDWNQVRSFIFTLAFLASGPSVYGDVITLDDSGGADFTDLQEAIDAGNDGDTILIRAGTYSRDSEHGLMGKALHLAAIPGEHVVVDKLRVSQLAENQSVYLSGIFFSYFDYYDEPGAGLVLTNCAGSIRVKNCGISHSLFVQSCSDVVLIESGSSSAGINSSHVSFYSSSLVGSAGEDGCYDGEEGETALYANNQSVLFFSKSVVHGGNGGLGDDEWGCCDSWDGGDGMVLSQGCQVYVTDTDVRGGFGADSDGCEDGQNGAAVVLLGGSTFEAWPLPARRIDSPWLVQSGDPVSLVVTGAPGDRVWLPRSRDGQWRLSVEALGVLNLAYPLPHSWLFLGTIPSSGVLAVDIPALQLAMGVPNTTLQFQPFIRMTQGSRILGQCDYIGVVSTPF